MLTARPAVSRSDYHERGMAERRYVNPDFHLEPGALHAEADRLRAAPLPLERPVIILGGWHSPGVANISMASRLKPFTSGRDADFTSITYPFAFSLRAAARHAVRVITDAGLRDREVDIVGISMGGIIARSLACDTLGLGPLNVRRIFTVATPHRGAKIARVVVPDPCAWQMRPASNYLCTLNERQHDGELHCYGALRDWWIGARNTAPPGKFPYWTDVDPGVGRLCTHFAINHSQLVMVDIARRLRSEEPIAHAATEPPID
jgi:pimeloyl-ACP methyl ester carboxylesterase